jgi:hypothetical protein
MRASEIFDRPDVIEQRVSVRLARQAVLTREPPPELRVILDEPALRRPVGGPETLRRQLRWLIDASERPGTSIQVLPMSIGAHRALDGAFNILEFANSLDPPLVYCPGLTGGVIRSRPEDVRVYVMCFEAIRAAALSPEESIEYVISLARKTPK